MRPDGYSAAMTRTHPANTEKVVYDPASGRAVVVRGAGALKGQLSLRKGVDLTKPIAAQVMKGKGRKSGSTHGKG